MVKRRALGSRKAFAPLCLALFLSALPASAQLRAEDKAAVLAHYTQGKALIEKGDVAEGCRELEAGKRIDPTAMNLLLRLADGYEKIGRTASAWNQYAEAAALGKAAGDPRGEVAAERAAALEGRLSRLTIAVDEAHSAPGLVIQRGGVVVGETLWNKPFPVDPGPHRVTFSSPSARTAEVSIEVAPGPSSARIVAPSLLPLTPASPPEAQPAPPAPASPDDPGQTSKAFAIALGGVGLIGVGVGAFFGLGAISARDASNDGHCDAESYCDDEGIRLRDEAQAKGTASTVAFGVGAASLAVGLTLWLTAPSSPKGEASVAPTAHVGPEGGALGLEGRF